MSKFRTDDQLKADGFSAADIHGYHGDVKQWEALSAEVGQAESAKDYSKLLDLEPRLEELTFLLKYQGVDPRKIPLAELKAMTNDSDQFDPVMSQYRQRIRNAGTAQRAFCVYCMGGNLSEIRRCEAIQCVLWPFRLGKNPFYGKTLPPVDDFSLPDDENVVVEDDDSENKDVG